MVTLVNECCHQTQQNDKEQTESSKEYQNIVVFDVVVVVVIKLNITPSIISHAYLGTMHL